MIHRRVAAAASAALCCAAVIACSGANDEASNATSDDALRRSPPICRIDENGDPTPPGCAESPPSYIDTCGVSHAIAEVPLALQGLGCRAGFYVDNQPVWTCPSEAAPQLPSALRLVPSNLEPIPVGA